MDKAKLVFINEDLMIVMVDRLHIKGFVAFVMSLFLFSLLSASVLAVPQFSANVTKFANGTNYNASSNWGFAIAILNSTNITGHDRSAIQTVVFELCRSGAGSCVNFTNTTAGISNIAGVTEFTNVTSTWRINFTGSQLGKAGIYNFTWYANDSAGVQNKTELNYFTISPYSPNITLTLDETDGDRTYNFGSSLTVSFKAKFNVTDVNSTSEQLFIQIDSNITGWVVSVNAKTNSTNITTFNETTMPLVSNRTYNITASWSGNENISAKAITVYLTAKDNQNPSISIIKPAEGSAFTESSAIFRFGVGDNAVGSISCNYKVDSGSFKSAGASTDISIDDLSSGDHTITVQCDDASSNRAESKAKFSINLAIGTPKTSASIVQTTPEGRVQVYIHKISANKQSISTIKEGDVSELTITVKNDVTSVYVNINKLDARPSDVPEASGKVFRYLDIKPSGLPENAITSAKIKFKVQKSWIADNKADPNKIVLKRFANGVWNNLDTAKISEDAVIVTYESETSGFSIFAISFDEAVPSVKIPSPAPTPTPTPPAPVPKPTPEVEGKPRELNYVYIIVGIGIFVAIVLFILFKGRRQ